MIPVSQEVPVKVGLDKAGETIFNELYPLTISVGGNDVTYFRDKSLQVCEINEETQDPIFKTVKDDYKKMYFDNFGAYGFIYEQDSRNVLVGQEIMQLNLIISFKQNELLGTNKDYSIRENFIQQVVNALYGVIENQDSLEVFKQPGGVFADFNNEFMNYHKQQTPFRIKFEFTQSFTCDPLTI